MKARVKATGEIVEVREEYDLREEEVQIFYSNEEDVHEVYEKEELDFDVKEKSFPKDVPDYWTRLEHTYAGMAMQGILAHEGTEFRNYIPQEAMDIAHALVEKMKEERK